MSAVTINQKNNLELPKVDWLDKEANPEKFFEDLSYALSEFGFMVLTNAPGFSDDFQQGAFKEVRGFFESSRELKKTAYIAKTPILEVTACPTQLLVILGKSLRPFNMLLSKNLCANTMTRLSQSIDVFSRT
jgi:isopenicillin N synthase-like dioxygenase